MPSPGRLFRINMNSSMRTAAICSAETTTKFCEARGSVRLSVTSLLPVPPVAPTNRQKRQIPICRAWTNGGQSSLTYRVGGPSELVGSIPNGEDWPRGNPPRLG